MYYMIQYVYDIVCQCIRVLCLLPVYLVHVARGRTDESPWIVVHTQGAFVNKVKQVQQGSLPSVRHW